MRAILKREFRAYFQTPLGYVLVAAFAFFANYYFFTYNLYLRTTDFSRLFTLLFLVSAAALGAYVYALRQRHLRAMERVSKVRVLAPRTAAPAPVLAVRTAR